MGALPSQLLGLALKSTAASCALIAIYLIFYPRRRVLTWFEFATDSDSDDDLANVVQELLWEWWTVLSKNRLHDPKGLVVEALLKHFKRLGAKSLVELCAGGGGASITWAKELRQKDPSIAYKSLLTDIHPNIKGWEARKAQFGDVVDYVTTPIDAMNVGKDLKDSPIRSINLALHHFPPDWAKKIIEDTVRTKGILLVGDLAPNRWTLCLNWVTCFPVGMKMLLSGRIPFKGPGDVLNPLKGIHDATVSVLRAYSTDELRELASQVEGGDAYEWTTYESESAISMMFGSWANGFFPPLMHFSILAPR